MAWLIRIEKNAEKALSKLSRSDQVRILNYLETNVAQRENPREIGAALTGPLAGLWKYRVGAFRILARISDSTVEILVVQIGNRRDVYR
ncbi:type II toxin-antitoxin system RelE/ParE family toxin [Mesorhizobium sp. LHD-90]|uniref:type II toxin-antitoxin system RelE family toxin n=1 Tax=Mesorhizobium sp. LHD-90 TaxID=3071414 RepID=UPI0027E08690|nr:type II toxin-antitoxin system RelE/ParE family toxin [Mesorhizobium sp. LHD-90]MDQ6433421.1 type II toxin-antitoxin system RelE/ParE family toxin [Mesorhizobium sp. LHD-90]